MIFIGLAGGKPAARKEIADRLERFGKSRLVAWSGSESHNHGRRMADLALALNDAGKNKALGGMVVYNLGSKEEADDIRRRGGVIWHVMGPPSESVPMERDDLKVTAMQGGCRHFLDAMDALSEHLLSIAAAH